MRFAAVFPFLCALAAFVLALLAVLAGSRQDFLQNFDMLTLNTSRLGQLDFNSSSGDGLLTSLQDALGDQAQDIVNGVVDDISQVLNIHDFYSLHLLDYCEGYYEPGPVVNETNSNPSKNTTRCTNPTPFAEFNPTAILQSELRPGINLSDLQWPPEVEDAVQAVTIAMRAMFVLYCIGLGFAGLSIIGALITFFAHGLVGAFVNFMLDLLSFLALGAASAIATAVIVKVVEAANQYGNRIGVAAYRGQNYLIITWIATALMLLAMFGWIVDCCMGRKKKREYKSSRV